MNVSSSILHYKQFHNTCFYGTGTLDKHAKQELKPGRQSLSIHQLSRKFNYLRNYHVAPPPKQ